MIWLRWKGKRWKRARPTPPLFPGSRRALMHAIVREVPAERVWQIFTSTRRSISHSALMETQSYSTGLILSTSKSKLFLSKLARSKYGTTQKSYDVQALSPCLLQEDINLKPTIRRWPELTHARCGLIWPDPRTSFSCYWPAFAPGV